MSISAIGSSTSIRDVSAQAASGSSAAPAIPQDSTSVSRRGQLMAELKSLQQSDPAKFKQVMADMSSQLKDAAKNATGDDAARLNKMAADFDQAAQTGQMPAKAAHGHHHHAKKAEGQQGSTATQAYAAQAQARPQGGPDLEKMLETALGDAGASKAA